MVVKRLLLALAAGAACFGLSGATAAERECRMLPPQVTESLTYSSGPSGYLCDTAQKPLWQGLPDGTSRVTRFVFTQGHGTFFRYVTITEAADGKARLEAGGADRPFRQPGVVLEPRRMTLSAAELARIERLVDDSGTFDLEVGSWDGGRLYLHCELLEMERADDTGYRFSSVNIGCNQPKKLMPLVSEIMRLAKLRFDADGMLIR